MDESSRTAAEDAGRGAFWGAAGIAVFCWLLAGYLLFTGGRARAVVDAAPRFVVTSGQVLDAMVKERGGTEQSSARVLVGYQVEGQDYSFTTNGQDAHLRFAGSRDAMLNAFAVGKSVEVFYDPTAPEIAALTRKPDAGQSWATGWVFVALAFGFSLWTWRRRKRLPAGTPDS